MDEIDKPKIGRAQRISEFSQEYRDFRTDAKSGIFSTSDVDLIFGLNVLNLLRRANYLDEQFNGKVEKNISGTPFARGSIDRLKQELINKYRNKKYRYFVQVFLGEQATSEEKIMRAIFGPIKGERTVTASELPHLPDNVFVNLLTRHVRAVKESKEEITRELPDFQRRLYERLENAISSGVLPINNRTMENRWKTHTVKIADPLKLEPQAGGFFNPNNYFHEGSNPDVVFLSVNCASYFGGNRQQRESIYTHEMMHLLSGRSMLAIEVSQSSLSPDVTMDIGDENSDMILHQRIGLGIGNQFIWLNEAMTEVLTMELLQNESRIYSKEREVLQLLRTSGKSAIPDYLFKNAYFENYDPSKPQGQRVLKWQALYRAINEAYKPGFLIKLDQYVVNKGIIATIKAMQQDWTVITKTDPKSLS